MLTDDVIGNLDAYAREWFGINGEVSGNSVGQKYTKHFYPHNMDNDALSAIGGLCGSYSTFNSALTDRPFKLHMVKFLIRILTLWFTTIVQEMNTMKCSQSTGCPTILFPLCVCQFLSFLGSFK